MPRLNASKTEPRWGVAFLVFYLFTVLMGWATAPYSTGLIAEGMAQTDMPQQQRQAAETMVGIMTHVGLFLVPLFAALWFVISSAIFKLAARLGNNDALTFRHILCRRCASIAARVRHQPRQHGTVARVSRRGRCEKRRGYEYASRFASPIRLA